MKLSASIPVICFVFFIIACKKDQSSGDQAQVIKTEVNSSRIYSDGFDELIITVRDENNKDITSRATVYIDGVPLAGNVFTTLTPKTFSVKARLAGAESAPVTVIAAPHTINRFSRKIILEEFAGAWCGYCPETTRLVDSFRSIYNNIIPVQVHNGDVFAYVYEPQMRNKFGISSFPSVYLNRFGAWDESQEALTNELNKRSKCGLSVFSSVSGANLTATVKIKFDVSTSLPLNLVLLLLEDSLVTPQNNLYNMHPGSPFYNQGNPILNYRHNNTLRLAATDIFGDPIPIDKAQKNGEYEKTFNLNTTGYAINNCKLVAFVLFKENTQTRFGVLNAQLVKAGQSKDFD